MTRREAVNRATERLRLAGVESPRLDAELLLCFTLGISRTTLAGHPGEPLSLSGAAAMERLVERRTQREPLPYLTGRRPFLDMELEVSPGVLIPRPETELLVDVGVRLLPPESGAMVVDVGVGSGAIAIAIARLRPRAQVCGTDRSRAALEIARVNVESFSPGRVLLLEGNLLEPLPGDWKGQVDLIVSNPPYIPTAEMANLEPEVSVYEPREALDGGPDGLDVVREIAAQARGWLKPCGSLAMEIGAGQAELATAALGLAGYRDIGLSADLSGIPRVISGRVATAAEPVLRSANEWR